MPCEQQTDKYKFCINSNYYETIVQYVKGKSDEFKKEENCDKVSLNTNLYENVSAENICKEFKFLYKSFSKYSVEKKNENKIFTDYDCDFLNYWLNFKLRESVTDGSINVKQFYKQIKEQNDNFFSKTNDLDEYLYDIDPNVLENMKLLYNLYDNAVKIMSIISNEDYINEEEKQKEQDLCLAYTKKCDENYKKAMDSCLNSNVDFYNALKNFKYAYDIIAEPSSNESNACDSSEFYYFPEYDALLEKKANAIKISSTLLVLSFALPLMYKFTPFGPFLRAKINMVKDRWTNQDKNGDELLPLSTDIEDIIFDNENYNIGYYSETN
ncbi:PIR Superfamily Protein [Plasmodium ovale wallikeri]|uniref:PIR Superfamily Protein n=1 Tax=Plasmodium ovale wallikeri TaxID=864142 RepID=A0A1A9ATE6_PLAOA|nr:PIR Superfamily Protein [Plasmodium ovale wallikeri]